MQRYLRVVVGSLVALSVILFGCAEQSDPVGVDPAATGASRSLQVIEGEVQVDEVVSMLQRTTPLPETITVSKVIKSKDGGTIKVPGTGLEVYFPKWALDQDTRIEITALAGSSISYTFEPHGIIFNEQVVLEQSLHKTNGFKTNLTLGAGYFEDVSLLTGPLATIAAKYPVVVDQDKQKVRFGIRHFSGYLFSID